MKSKAKHTYKHKPLKPIKKAWSGMQDLAIDEPAESPLASGSLSKFGNLGQLGEMGSMGKGAPGMGVASGAIAIGSNLANSFQKNHIQTNNLVQTTSENPFKEGQGAKDAFNDTLQGAQAGAEFGPWGAVVGGAIGLGAGIYSGAVNAKKRKQFDTSLNEKNSMQRDRDYKYNISDPYKGLNYKKGTKNIDKPNIEFEGGEPIFSPKKKDGSRDLIYYSPDGPKHSEGGIPGKVVAKNHYKTKPNSKGAVKMPEGSAIVTAKKDLGKRAVEAHTAGKDDIVEKIISKMPSDKNFKKVGGDRSASLNNKRVTDANDNEDSYDFNDLSPEDYNRLSPLVKTHDDVQKILSAKRAELGHDLSRSEMDSALTGYNTKYGTNYNWNDYNNSVKELSNFNTGRGKTPLNFRGNTEGKTAGAVDDYTGIYGNRNARARIAISQRQATPPSTLPSTTAAPKLTSAARTGYVPIQGPSSTIQDKPTKGGLPYSMRVSDANNIVQGIKGPDIQRLQRYNPTINPYYDLSDPSRRYSRKISSIERANAFNLSGGNAGNARANSMNALGEDANRQQDINNNELGRYDRIREQNVGIQNEANLMNTNIANQEQDINAANRQAARDQFQAGLVGFDENNYRNKITNADYRANQERNNIEKQRLGLLNNYFPNYTNNGGIGVQYRPTGIAGNSVPNTQVNNPLVAGSGRAAQDEEEFSKLAGVLKKGSKSIKKPKYKAKKS